MQNVVGSSPPEAALLFLLRKRELSSGVVALLCLVSMTDHSCMWMGRRNIQCVFLTLKQ